MARSCWLYRAYDADDRLLYVGISTQLGQRLDAHRLGSSWADFIATLRVEQFESTAAASAREVALIAEHQPPYNVKGKRLERPGAPHLEGRLNCAEMGEVLSESARQMRRFIDAGEITPAEVVDGEPYVEEAEFSRWLDTRRIGAG